jgi:surface antigen/microcystin-dependent protein
LKTRPRAWLGLALLVAVVSSLAAPAHAHAFAIDCNQGGIGCITFSGYAGGSVWGYPVDAAGNNCTNYAAFRLARNGAANPGNLGNAGSWGSNAAAKGFPVNGTPAVGAIAWFNYGHPWSPGTGHVAYVDGVNGDEISLSDSNWQGGSKRWRVRRGERNYPSGFIHIRDVGAPTIGEGSFVSTPDGAVYRVAGGAPIYVSTWSAYGGAQPTTSISFAQLNAMRPWPENNTFVHSVQDGAVYRIAGGAPIYVSTWDTYGGAQPTVAIDKWAIDHVGHTPAHMHAVPADNTFVHSVQDGAVYRIAGGAPIYVSTWDTYGGAQPTVAIDKWAIDHVGHTPAHMHAVPADNTFVHSAQDGAVYRIAGGAPIYVSTWDTYGGAQPTVAIDKWAIDHVGHSAAHMRAVPADGTFLHSIQDGAVYRVAGGAPLYVPSWDVFGGARPHVSIDRWAVTNAGTAASHLLKTPRDGTLLRGLPSQAVWRIVGGKRVPHPPQSGYVDINDPTVLGFPLDEPSPDGGVEPQTYGVITGVALSRRAVRVRQDGSVVIRVVNANSFVVTGEVFGKTLRKVVVGSRVQRRRVRLGSKSFSVGADAAVRVALQLPRRLRRILARTSSVPLRLTARVRDPAGNTRLVTTTIRAKAPTPRQ